MWLLLACVALAGEPGSVDLDPPDPGLSELGPALTWAEVSLSPAAPESPALGPDQLALGPDGRWAVYSPVDHHVIGEGLDLALPPVDGLGFAPDGDLLVLTGRELTRWEGSRIVARTSLPALAPSGAPVRVSGDRVDVVDVFGNLHPVADLSAGTLATPPDAPRLLPSPHRVSLAGGRVTVDGRSVAAPADTLGARAVGDWILVEAGVRGAVRAREAISLRSGKVVSLPLRSAAPYRASSDVAVGPDGELGWLDPRADGLYVRREAP